MTKSPVVEEQEVGTHRWKGQVNKGRRRTTFPAFRAVPFPSRGTEATWLDGWKHEEAQPISLFHAPGNRDGSWNKHTGQSGPRRLWERNTCSRLADKL